MATNLDINKGFVAIEVTEEQQLAAEHLFDNTITKTMVDVKLEQMDCCSFSSKSILMYSQDKHFQKLFG
jgi:hypothetical protein